VVVDERVVVVCERLVLGASDAVLLVLVVVAGFDGDDVDGDEVDGDDVVAPVFKGLLVLVHTPWALQLP
jgi:hypothetical protein